MKSNLFICIITSGLLLSTLSLKAQILTGNSISVTDTNGPLDFEYRTNGTLIAKGSYGTASLPDSGAGTRFIWYPGKGALRAGIANGTEWDDANIGTASVGLGQNVKASGVNSVALGYNVTATGTYSYAMGFYSNATGYVSTAIGLSSTASGPSTAVFNGGSATGSNSTVIGGGSSTASQSLAMNNATTVGTSSFAEGQGSISVGQSSSAMGYNAESLGNFTLATGYYTTATAYQSTVIGAYNLGTAAPGAPSVSYSSWVSTDPLFEIGNGTSSAAKSDALVVYKNGIVAVHTYIRSSPGGDLSMGSFTAGTAP